MNINQLQIALDIVFDNAKEIGEGIADELISPFSKLLGKIQDEINIQIRDGVSSKIEESKIDSEITHVPNPHPNETPQEKYIRELKSKQLDSAKE